MPDRADRAPGEIAEVDDQVGWNPITFVVYVLRFVDGGADVDTVGISQGFKFCCEFVPQRFDFVSFDDALWLAPFNIQEDARIIATISPNPGLAPVNLTPVDRGQGDRLRLQCQVSLLDEPFIDADATIHLFGAVVGDDEDGGVFIDEIENLPNLAVDIA